MNSLDYLRDTGREISQCKFHNSTIPQFHNSHNSTIPQFHNTHTCELLAPAGDFETALAAFEAGADAVYCGLAAFSARAFAKNLTADELRSLMRVAKASGRKVYVTFNTLIEQAEMRDAIEKLALLDEIGVDGIIVQDLGIAKIARENFPRLSLHASTQLVAHNLEGVLALKELGFVRVVLAREMTLAEIESLTKRCGVEIECFIHGALCYSLSGLCLFSAMEHGRSGNRGRCAYCCRMPGVGNSCLVPRASCLDGGDIRHEARDTRHEARGTRHEARGTRHDTYPFSMRDLRLGEDARRLAAAGVASLKIEGRMKSPLYVASAVKYYREILDGSERTVSEADLETVFSRRTTKLYLDGRRGDEDVLDSSSLGHIGTPIGRVKRVTKDREGRSWLRFHTERAIVRHDGIQIVSPDGAKKCGFGIGEMRQAISRRVVFAVDANTDVEVFVGAEDAKEISPGDVVRCSMSNEMKRRFPVPAYRASDYPGTTPISVTLKISPHEIQAEATGVSASIAGDFSPARNPAATKDAAVKAFSKLGDTDYALANLELDDPDGLFAPASMLNELRRELVRALDDAKRNATAAKIAAALENLNALAPAEAAQPILRTVKLTATQPVPPGDWDEVIRLIPDDDSSSVCSLQCAVCSDERVDSFSAREQDAPQQLQTANCKPQTRIALPVFTPEGDFNKLRVRVKRLLRMGYTKWEASDLATLRMLKSLGITDITADWTLYAANTAALALLAQLGIRRIVASPENSRENLDALADAPFAVEFLESQHTPLFISLNRPGEPPAPYVVNRRGNLWITTRTEPRSFYVPSNASTRLDKSYES